MTGARFVWYELVTNDIDAGLAFYRHVLGWQTQEVPGADPRYVMLLAGGKPVGGAMTLPAGMDGGPFWLGYVHAPDIDAQVARFRQAGGAVHRGPWQIMDVGRIALVSDPQGAGLALFQPTGVGPSEAFSPGAPGHGNWHELRTTDPEAAFAFYAGQFGWTKGEAMDMGEMGKYQIFQAGDAMMGGMMRGTQGRPAWLYYFGTPGIDGALNRIEEGGGTVLNGPAEVPGGAFVVQARDPQGAMFAVVGPR